MIKINEKNKERLRIFLGQREAIALRSIDKVSPELRDLFIILAEELDYHKCDRCHYYINGKKYNHSSNLCYSCHEKIMELAGEKEE